MSLRMKNALILIGVIIGVILLLCIIGSALYISLFTDKVIDIDMGTIVSIILALFSIFISMLFYFKASETSNKFYDYSIDHMSRQSELLGRIEERFGAQLGTIDEKLACISGISDKRSKKEKELEIANSRREELNKKLEAESTIPGPEKIKLREEIQRKEEESFFLKKEISELDKKLRTVINELNKQMQISELSRREQESYMVREQRISKDYLVKQAELELAKKENNEIHKKLDTALKELEHLKQE